jgi:hypothetical protein
MRLGFYGTCFLSGLFALPQSGGSTLALGVGVCFNRLMLMRFHGTCLLFGLFALPLSGAGLTFFAHGLTLALEVGLFVSTV